MIKKAKYPILEFDDNKEALINPTHSVQMYGRLEYIKLVITFFGDAIEEMLKQEKIVLYKQIVGENTIVLYKFIDSDVLLMHGTIGCPACAGWLDELIGMGIQKILFCGGGGVLDKTIDVGHVMVVEGAIRDEGFSYHYVKPSRIIYADQSVNKLVDQYLTDNGVPHFSGLAWTTDAFYRETIDKVLLRKQEGAKIVEMEQSGCLAVAQFRNVKYAGLIYAGDDVSQEKWDNRSWRSREGIRYNLVLICKELLNII